MSSDQKKSLDELMQKLSADARAKVVDFADYLFEKNNLLKNPDFASDLKQACQSAFDRYPHPAYYSMEDLQQDVLLRVLQPRTIYTQDKLKEFLYRIAVNNLIDLRRKESSGHRHREEVAFDNLDNRMPPDSAAKPVRKLKQNWAGGLSDYSSQYTSLELQKKALEWRGD
jgi:DNA-directed RNA polymerase specialized sigma24 family protein